MAELSILNSNLNSSRLFLAEADSKIDYLAPKEWNSSDRNILRDLKTVEPNQAPRYGSTSIFDINVSDVLTVAYLRIRATPLTNALEDTARPMPKYAGVHAIRRVRVRWGNTTLEDIQDYPTWFNYALSKMDEEKAKMFLEAAGGTTDLGPGVNVQRDYYVPIPLFNDFLHCKTQPVDARNLSGQLRVEVELAPGSRMANFDPAGDLKVKDQPELQLHYHSYVFSSTSDRSTVEAVNDPLAPAQFKSVEFETSSNVDVGIGAANTVRIKLDSFVGSKREIAVLVRPAASADYDADGRKGQISGKYLKAAGAAGHNVGTAGGGLTESRIRMLVNGRTYYEISGGSRACLMNSVMSEATMSKSASDAAADESYECHLIPIAVDNDRRNYAGGANITRLSDTAIEVRNLSDNPVTVSLVLVTDTLYEYRDGKLFKLNQDV